MEHRQATRGRVWGLLAGSGSWGVFWGGWAALLPGIKDQVGVDASQLGLALFAIPVGALPAMLGMGPVFDRYGRGAFGVTLVLFAAAVVSPGFTYGVIPLAVSLLLVGATSGAIEVGLNAATAAVEAETGRRLFHQVHAVTPVAMIVAAPAVGLVRQFGATPLPILAAIGVVVALTALPNLSGVPRGVTGGAPVRAGGKVRFVFSWRIVVFGLAGAAVLFIENAVEQWSALLLVDELRASAFVASLGPAAYMAALALGRLLAQRYGAGLTPRTAVALAGVAGGLGVGLASITGHPVVALAGFAVAGLGTAAALPTLLATAGRLAAPQRRGAAVSTVTTVSYLGFLASPACVGAASGAVGLPYALGLVAGLGVLLAAGCVLLPARR
ncbi:MAG: hypothetical protein ACRDTU_13165 [Micromonosporaceae bacterium]